MLSVGDKAMSEIKNGLWPDGTSWNTAEPAVRLTKEIESNTAGLGHYRYAGEMPDQGRSRQ